MDVLTPILLFCVGGVAAMLIDTVWWHVHYQKIEKGFEIIEHYHIGLGLFITGIIVNQFIQEIAWFVTGMGLLFIIAEWHQAVEISNKKVIPGKPFAWGSKHFRGSSIIGIILAIILLIFTLVL